FTFSALKWLTDEEVASDAVVDNRNAAGFHVPGRFDRILDIQKCYLQEDLSNEIRNSVKQLAFENNLTFYNQKEHNGLLRNLIVRNTTLGEWMIIVCFGEDNKDEIELVMNHINKNFTTLTSLQYVVNQKLNDTIHDQEVVLYAGRDHIFEKLDDLKFKIGPKSFFQTNSNQAEVLYQKTKEFAKITENDVVYDLYTGTGTIANYVAKNAKKVVGIEYVEDAIKDAHINSELNDINNTLFYAGDMKDILNDEFISKHGSPDVIITDPPRAGMHEDVVNTIRRADPKRIVYVSCNPATQARDLAMLSDVYEITNVQPVDMFPHTHHVENIVALEKKQA
ncbi:MAG: 23S rRNA (uracil(1939)-C(5))-methyltransferase RlmD, partial [Bacteroidales bacterium]|nr:23S rRNA (uracil(1939)-C(5))-methyltransferase RlmD [Bacteroidales bacterium]